MTSKNFLEQYLPSLYTCIKCRGCMSSSGEAKPVCPMAERYGFFSYSAGGMVALARSIYEGELEWGTELAEVIYNCTMCRACAEQCRNIYYLTNEYFNVASLVEKMRGELVEQGKIPPLVRDYLKSVDLYGNPYQISGNKRGKWAEKTGIPLFSGQEFLFYVGDEGCFDDRGITIAQTVGTLIKGFVSVGILGNEEISDGNEVKALGERGLFELLVERNMEKFQKLGVKKIVTLSPHGYHAMKNEYSRKEGDFQVMHYTQLLEELIDRGKLSFSELRTTVTYHDPCYLGRHNHEYEGPRRILKSIPGVELVEMRWQKEEAFCCGGGGGNFFTNMLGNDANSPGRIRARQAYETKAKVLAVACPACAKMLGDAVKDEGLEGGLEVKDIAEIVTEAMGRSC